MESKKRPPPDDSAPVSRKKPMLSSASPQISANGSVEAGNGEPISVDTLEQFRKEAIYRKMKYYSRENERKQQRIAELELRKSKCEASLAAMTACWNQLLETIQLLANPDELPPLDPHIRESLTFPKALDDEQPDAFTSALETKRSVTAEVVTKFLQLGGATRQDTLRDRSYTQCQALQTECTALRSQVALMGQQLSESKELGERLSAQLADAENRAERAQSLSVVKVHVSRQSPAAESAIEPPQRSETRSPHPMNGTMEKESSLNAWKGLASTRLNHIEKLNTELKNMHARYNEAQVTIASLQKPSPTAAMYQPLLQHVSYLEKTLQEVQASVAQQNGELEATRRERDDLKSVVATYSESLQELRSSIPKRDAENARMREERDRAKGEFRLAERKLADLSKQQSTDELRALAQSRLERVCILQAEVSRLKGRLAAGSNDKELLHYILSAPSGTDIDVKYIEYLKERLTAAEFKVTSLETTVSHYDTDKPDIPRLLKSEADLRYQLQTANAELERFRSIYADATSKNALKRLEDEVARLQLLESNHAQSESSLYTELDKLSAAWEALDKKIESKIFDLAAVEERAYKAGLDKAKLETKYYASIKDRDSIDNERKNLQRLVEKQLKFMEKYKEQETITDAQLRDYNLEKDKLRAALEDTECRIKNLRLEVETSKKEAMGYKEHYEKLVSAPEGLLKKAEHLCHSWISMKNDLSQKAQELEVERISFNEDKEKFIRERTTSEAGESKGDDKTIQQLYTVINCSTCHQRPRTHHIAKCYHTFCHECLDVRLKNRMRKCPSCSAPFAQQDVQPIYFQG